MNEEPKLTDKSWDIYTKICVEKTRKQLAEKWIEIEVKLVKLNKKFWIKKVGNRYCIYPDEQLSCAAIEQLINKYESKK